MHLRTHWLPIGLILLSITITACAGSANPGQTAPPVDQAGEAQAPTLEAGPPESDGLPSGVLVDPQSGDKLYVYTPTGQHESTLDAPGLSGTSSQIAHLAGAALVYQSWEPEQALQVNEQGSIRSLRSTQGFFGLAGAAGQSALAFSEVVVDGMLPHSYLYASNLDSLAASGPFYDLYDENMQMALLPVAVEAAGSQPKTVWYTQSAWGIGGVDLIFPINRGLYAYDLSANQPGQALDSTRNFQGISPDMRLAASTAFDAQADQSLTVNDFASGQQVAFPLRANSERGAGYAVFSPDGLLVAWLEAGGSFAAEPSTYHSVVRIGETANGGVDYEIEDGSIAQALNLGHITYMKPAGWLDNHTLLIETRASDWGNVVLVSADLSQGTLAYFCDGAFAGFVYP